MGNGNITNGTGAGRWIQPVLLGLLAISVPLVVSIVTASSFGSRYAERVDQQGVALTASISQLAASGAERANALSARLNSQEEGVRSATVLAARQEERLANLERKIDERGRQRDNQIEELNRKLEGQSTDMYRQIGELRTAVIGTQVGLARIETLLGRLYDLQDPRAGKGGDSGPLPRGRN